MPQRKTPLKAKTEMSRGAGFKRANDPKKRTSTLKQSAPKGVPARVRDIIRRRSEGLCEIGLACRGAAAGTDSAHREGKKIGGTSKRWSNAPSNVQWACRPCHRLTDAVAPAAAERLGYKLREGVARPWEVPVKHARLGWVLLDDRGGFRPAPEGSHQDGKRPIPVVAGAAFAEAVERYGHAQCPGRPTPAEGPYTCSCGSSPFWLIEVTAS
ncbi:HNH endonuclease [Nonomuraea sp. NPDC049714]|uniref:HNH endonuclease n=1 Tax=Nonomuraea sp. NPDC049714 TaxID=3364357 RepID=UPI003791A648